MPTKPQSTTSDTPEQRAELRAQCQTLLDEGWTPTQIGRKFGRNESWVRYLTDRKGYRSKRLRVRTGPRRYRLGPSSADQIQLWTPRTIRNVYPRQAVIEAIRASKGRIPTKRLLAMLEARI